MLGAVIGSIVDPPKNKTTTVLNKTKASGVMDSLTMMTMTKKKIPQETNK